MMQADFLWRMEGACRAAWPALEEDVVDGWLLRLSGGGTRRVNSLNPMPGRSLDAARVLDAAEARFAAAGQPALIRVADFARELDVELDRRGYGCEGRTRTLLAPLDGISAPSPDIALLPKPDARWLAARERLGSHNNVFRRMLAILEEPAAFAAAMTAGEVVAIAYGAIRDGVMVVESVATDPAFRGRGYARRMISALMAWAHRNGAAHSCLQVQADNAPALALYRRLGYERELYDYRYRRRQDESRPL